jgi:hypothetical protein
LDIWLARLSTHVWEVNVLPGTATERPLTFEILAMGSSETDVLKKLHTLISSVQ